jgi:hypothetical protein
VDTMVDNSRSRFSALLLLALAMLSRTQTLPNNHGLANFKTLGKRGHGFSVQAPRSSA